MSIGPAYPSDDGGGGSSILLADYSHVILGLNVDFTDESFDGGNVIISHFWDFDDTFTSALPDPSHLFAGSGTYNVSLSVTDDVGNVNTTQRPIIVAGANVPPVADFTFADTGLDVQFTDTSTDIDGTVDAWLWDFGD